MELDHLKEQLFLTSKAFCYFVNPIADSSGKLSTDLPSVADVVSSAAR